jgi:hypothetical protein
MSERLDEFKRICQPLSAFSYRYFDNLKPEELPHMVYDFILSPLEIYEQVQHACQRLPEMFKAIREEDEVMELWAHKEMLLKCLVVLTNLNFLYEPLKKKSLLEEAVALRDRLIDDFTETILDDPAVLAAIQDGSIEAEIEKRRHAKVLFNFKPLFEQQRSFVVDPGGAHFQEIPEKF